jgi:hypothetical protein
MRAVYARFTSLIHKAAHMLLDGIFYPDSSSANTGSSTSSSTGTSASSGTSPSAEQTSTTPQQPTSSSPATEEPTS